MNASQLKGHPKLHMGKVLFGRTQKDMYSTLINAFEFYGSNAREFWIKYCKKRIPFLSIAHDIWESKEDNVLGISACFTDPVTARKLYVPLDLISVSEKGADATAQKCLEMMELCGFEKEDIFRASNDTTNSAVRTGELLSGLKGTCLMHELELALKHAIGWLTRKRNNRIVDSFDKAEELRELSFKVARYLMEKRAKSRLKKYAELMKKKVKEGRPSRFLFPTRLNVLDTYFTWRSRLQTDGIGTCTGTRVRMIQVFPDLLQDNLWTLLSYTPSYMQ